MSEDQATEAAAAQDGEDPSMEEILASIRKIITDDDKPAAEGEATEEPSADAPPVEEDVLELTDEVVDEPAETETMTAETEVADETQEASTETEANSQAGIDDLFASEPAAAEPGPEPEPTPEPEPAPEPEAPSNAMADAMDSAQDSMDAQDKADTRTQAVTQELSDMEEQLLSEASAAAAASSLSGLTAQVMMGAGNQSLENVVKAVLRPLLKDWLNENLPVIVEKLVRAEIDKITN